MEKVLDYIRKNGMVQRGDRIIAGVSGGPDSVCLLFLLDKYKETLGISLEGCPHGTWHSWKRKP